MHPSSRYEIKFEAAENEPVDIHWENISRNLDSVTVRISRIVSIIALAIICWAVFIYGPFGYYEYINFSKGFEPDAMTDFAFSMIVVGGNLAMYTLCDFLADGYMAESQGKRDSVYVMCFFAATTVNLILDVGLPGLSI